MLNTNGIAENRREEDMSKGRRKDIRKKGRKAEKRHAKNEYK